MTNDLWIRLRRLQANPAHLSYRPRLLDLLQRGVFDWRDWVEAFEADGLCLETLWKTCPEKEGEVATEARSLGQRGFRCLTPADPEFPERWLATADPPLTLSVLGSVHALSSPALSVVGSREPVPESLAWMEAELTAFCRQTRATIVSGGARGIDQKAHSVALRSGSPTVALLPSGLDFPYPADFRRWFPAIVEGGGAVVSEYPATMPMRKPHFHHRNRLIAAAARMVLIVEARLRSGTLITATRAAEIGRPLFVVPGHPHQPHFCGSLQLLSEGGTLVRQAEDLTLFWQAESAEFFEPHLPLGVAEKRGH